MTPPRKLRLLQRVESDMPFPPRLVALPRIYEEHEIKCNQHGAVALVLAGGLLGIKPAEFEWIDQEPPL